MTLWYVRSSGRVEGPFQLTKDRSSALWSDPDADVATSDMGPWIAKRKHPVFVTPGDAHRWFVVKDGVLTGPHTTSAIEDGIARRWLGSEARLALTENGPWVTIREQPAFALGIPQEQSVWDGHHVSDYRESRKGGGIWQNDGLGLTILFAPFGALGLETLILLSDPSAAPAVAFLDVALRLLLLYVVVRDGREHAMDLGSIILLGCICGVFARSVYFGLRKRRGGQLGFAHAVAVDILYWLCLAFVQTAVLHNG